MTCQRKKAHISLNLQHQRKVQAFKNKSEAKPLSAGDEEISQINDENEILDDVEEGEESEKTEKSDSEDSVDFGKIIHFLN